MTKRIKTRKKRTEQSQIQTIKFLPNIRKVIKDRITNEYEVVKTTTGFCLLNKHGNSVKDADSVDKLLKDL